MVKSEQGWIKSEQKVNRLLLFGIFCSLLGYFYGLKTLLCQWWLVLRQKQILFTFLFFCIDILV